LHLVNLAMPQPDDFRILWPLLLPLITPWKPAFH